MTVKKAYPLRISADIFDAIQHWADDELRSLNAQIEYVLRESLRKQGRLKAGAARPADDPGEEDAP
ncbi:hypothetical protein BH11PSE14_BH11PSE14_24020 [soil metagenome]